MAVMKSQIPESGSLDGPTRRAIDWLRNWVLSVVWPTANLADDSVTNAKLANMAADTIKGRANGAGTGDPTDLTVAQVKTVLGVGVQSKVLVAINYHPCTAALTTTTAAQDLASCTSGALALKTGDIVDITATFDCTNVTAAIILIGTLDVNGVEQAAQALHRGISVSERTTVAQQWMYTVPSDGNYTFKLRGRHNIGATGQTINSQHTTLSYRVYR